MIARTALADLLSEISGGLYGPTGSREICDPAPTDADDDWVLLAGLAAFPVLENVGFVMTCDPEYAGGSWMTTWRLGDYNLIASDDAVFVRRFLAATALAKKMNLTQKEQRIALFQDILYGPLPERSKILGDLRDA